MHGTAGSTAGWARAPPKLTNRIVEDILRRSENWRHKKLQKARIEAAKGHPRSREACWNRRRKFLDGSNQTETVSGRLLGPFSSWDVATGLGGASEETRNSRGHMRGVRLFGMAPGTVLEGVFGMERRLDGLGLGLFVRISC